jgi:WD40 repeat protein
MGHIGRLAVVVWLVGVISIGVRAEDRDALVTLKPTHPVANPSRQDRSVTRLNFSADGSRLLVQTDATTTLWNLATRKPAMDIPPRHPNADRGDSVFSINGGAFFVVAQPRGNFALRDVATGASRGAAKFPPPQTATGFPNTPATVISRDGKWMACAFNSHPGPQRTLVNGKPVPREPCTVILFDTRTGAPRHTWTPKTKPLVADKYAPPGAPQDAAYVFALEFSPDAHYLATATTDGNVAVYDTAAGTEVGAFNEWDEHKYAPTQRDLHQDMFTWTHDGRSLIMPASLQHDWTPCWTVTGRDVRDLRWPPETAASTTTAPPAEPPAPRGRPHLPTPSEQMRLSRQHTGQPVGDDTRAGPGGSVAWQAFSSDGHYAVFAFSLRQDGNPFNDQSRLSIADLSAGRNLGSVHVTSGAVTYIRFSPDNKKVAWGTHDGTACVTTLDALIAMAHTAQQIR